MPTWRNRVPELHPVPMRAALDDVELGQPPICFSTLGRHVDVACLPPFHVKLLQGKGTIRIGQEHCVDQGLEELVLVLLVHHVGVRLRTIYNSERILRVERVYPR